MTLGDFSQQAEAYRQARPTYPRELINQLIADAKVQPGDAVADFGAGTGILTSILVELGFRVSAIEPNQAMRTQANVPTACWISGTFEESHLAAASQRWAVAAQAFHWANPRLCLPEMRRILQPGCLFTILWNDRSKAESGIVQWTEEAIRRHVPEFDEAYRDHPWNEVLESTGDFRFLNQRTIRHTISMSRDRYLQLWKSHNRLNTIAGPDRFANFMRELANHLDRQQSDQIDVLYDCQSWSAVRIKN